MRRAACAWGDWSLSEIPRAEFSMPRMRLRPILAQSGPLGLISPISVKILRRAYWPSVTVNSPLRYTAPVEPRVA